MRVFLSCVSTEFKSYRLKLANQLGALKDHLYEVKVQEDFQQGGFTLLDKLADYVREFDLVIHFAGDACGARPTPEHVRALFHSLGDALPDPLPDWSYTQWEYRLALRFHRKMLVYLAAAEAPRDCPLPVQQSDEEARLQQAHLEAIRQSGKHRAAFTSYNTLVREVFHDLGLEPDLKVNNLPYKSLGSLFKGREEFLGKMHAALGQVEHRGHQRFAAITASAATVYGLGGIGKTRAAIEYAHRYAEEYTALLFVRADTPGGLQQNLATLCGPTVLDLPEKDVKEIEVQLAAVLQWLKQHPAWLLIFDNVDTEDAAQVVQELLGSLTPAGQVLVTSRLSNWPGAVQSLVLDVLEKTDAAAFLLERTAKRRKMPDDDHQAIAVAVELGRLALALEQAGAYIEHYRGTFVGYLTEWQQQREKVLEWFDPRVMQYPMSVAVTWQTSFDSLHEGARGLLETLAWLAPDPIPESLLEARGGPFASVAEGNESGVRDALAELDEHSLITRADDTPTFSVHRLVQDVTRRSLPKETALVDLKASLRWLIAAFVGNPNDVRTWPMLTSLAPHALAVARYADEEQLKPTASLMNQLGGLYLYRAQYSQSEPLMRRVLEIYQQDYGPDHPYVAASLNNLAQLLHATNRLKEAEPLMRRALTIAECTSAPPHPKVAASVSNLSTLSDAGSRPEEAAPLMRQALTIGERASGPVHPDIATYLNNLAQLLKDTNRLAEVEPLLQRTVEVFEAAYGPNHPLVGAGLNNLAQFLKDTNRLAEAEPLMRRVLAIDENSFGLEHPEVATDLNNLALLLKATKRMEEAELPLRRGLAINENSYGPNHPEVAVSLNNLASLLKATKRMDEAEPLLRRALAINENSYGPNHPKVAISLGNLATLLHSTKRTDEAEPLLRRVVEILERSFGPNHPDVATSLNNLAQLLRETDRLEQAEPLMRRHLEIFWMFTRSAGHEHPHLRTANGNYAMLLHQMGYTNKQTSAKLNEIANRYGFSLGT
jgi:tetratricopeptide (TPR) repeat protein